MSIKELYKLNIKIIELIGIVVSECRKQNFDTALRKIKTISLHLNQILEYISQHQDYFEDIIKIETIISNLKQLLQAQSNKDYCLLADVYETEILSIMYKIQALIQNKEKIFFDEDMFENNKILLKGANKGLLEILKREVEDEEIIYELSVANNGSLTIKMTKDKHSCYLHSCYNPINEAKEYVKSFYDVTKDRYIIYGFGLGYHILELGLLDRGAKIEVYENNLELLQIAFTYQDLSHILMNENIVIYYDKDFSLFSNALKNMDDNTKVCIYYPELKFIDDNIAKNSLDNFFIKDAAIKNQLQIMQVNFRCNVKNYDGIVDELRYKFKNNNLIIVAAGPSLDKNIKYLKEKPKNTLILATGTILRKLLELDIIPDYVIITDANERVCEQILKVENRHKDIPLLFLSTVTQLITMNYQGEKYIILQKDFDLAENYAKQKGYNTYATGGSVSTTALELGIRFQCSKIIFIGLDLAYTDGFAHASGTNSLRNMETSDSMQEIKDIHGGKVFASKVFCMYRRWIEDRVEQAKNTDIVFINATEGGAFIEGFQAMTLLESFKLCQ